jgi:peroxiredoxin
MPKILQPGTKAPDFTLPCNGKQTVSLKDFRGNPLIIAFYPADWSPVCSAEMTHFNDALPSIQKHKANLVGISVDGIWCHTAFTSKNDLHFTLLSDSEPKGAVAKKYGAFNEEKGVCERALFVIDKDGTIVWSYLSPMLENPGSAGILQALETLDKSQSKVKASSKR